MGIMRSLTTYMSALGGVVLTTFVGFTIAIGVAGAQDVADIVSSVDNRGYYIEPGATVDLNRVEQITSRSASDGRPTAVVILAAEPDTIVEDDLAAQIVESVADIDAAVVLWGPAPGERGLGAAGLEGVYGDAEIDAAADAAAAASVEGSSLGDLAEAFIEALPPGGAAASESGGTDDAVGSGSDAAAASSDSGGGGFPWLILLIPGIGIGAWLWFRSRRRKLDQHGSDDDITTARTEIREQLEVVANEILEHEDSIGLSNNADAIEHYRQASATYKQVSETLDETTNLLALADLNDRVDHARWRMDAAEALVEGRPAPPKPAPEKPAACFFDPTHKPGTVEATVKTAAGEKEVQVCPSCAAKLDRGERPDPRMIDVRGRRVPAAKAPRSHGGGGMGGLDIFEIVLGGLGGVLGGALGGSRGRRNPVSLDWGSALGNKRRTRSVGGVFGPDRLPPRTGGGFGRSMGGGRRAGGRARRRM